MNNELKNSAENNQNSTIMGASSSINDSDTVNNPTNYAGRSDTRLHDGQLMLVNETRLTLENQLEFNLYHGRFANIILLIVVLIAGIIADWSLLVYDPTDIITPIAVWIVLLIVIMVYALTYKKSLRKRVEKLISKSPIHDANNVVRFSFYENILEITNFRMGEINSTGRVRYSDIIKTIERKNLIFMYIGVNVAHIISCDSMTQGTKEELKALLRSKPIRKYVITKS